jgi:uncharacterized membrane protein YphA (DoxX/SURF4 family)
MQRFSFSLFQPLLASALSLLLGGFFVVSGIGKLLDVGAFANTLYEYGLGSIAWVAVFVPPAEVLLGLALAFGIHHRLYAIVSLVLLVVLSIAFAQAYLGHGVQDCGCFGAIHVLKSSPLVSFGRNGLFMLFAALLWYYAPDEVLPLTRWQHGSMIVLGAVLCAASGLSYHKPFLAQHPFEGERLALTPLQPILARHFGSTSQDSALAIFVFGVGCSRCWNMSANVKEFATNNTAGHVVGIAGGDSLELVRYQKALRPNFPVALVADTTVERLVSRLPTLFLVRKGVIERVVEGEIPSPHVLSR